MVQQLGKKYNSAENEKSANSCTKKDKAAAKKISPAVKSISFAVDAGEVFGLLGHNGTLYFISLPTPY